MPAAIDLRGRLDPRALQRAFDLLVARHETLRTTFRERHGQPLQVVAEPAPQPLPLVDLSDLAAAQRAAKSDVLAAAEANRCFDLARGPLLRASLHRIGPDHHRLIVNLHHIIIDGWSLRLAIAALAACYRAFASGHTPPAAPPALQAIDHALWQRQQLAVDAVRERHLAFWRQTLEGMPTALALPAERPRPALPSGRGGVVPLAFDEANMQPLRTLARRAESTLFSTLLAAFGAFLHRLTGTCDLGIGTPVAGRRRVETEDIIGLLVNTLVLRLRPRRDRTLLDLTSEAQRATSVALAHQELPLELVVDDLAPARAPGHNPLFQVLFSFQDDPATEAALDGLRFAYQPLHGDTAKLELALELFDHGGRVSGWLAYSRDLFDHASATRLAARWTTFLHDAAARPEAPIAELAILPEQERAALEAFNDTVADDTTTDNTVASPRRDARLDRLIVERAAQAPEAVAVVFEGCSLTYRALVAAADHLAARLRRHGAGPEVVVGICAERSLELVVGLLAVLRAGSAYVPLDPSYPRRRLAAMIADAGAGLLLVQRHVRASLPDPMAAVVLLLDPATEALCDDHTAPLPESAAGADNLAYTIFTSGSTGRPKGAMNTHRAIVNRLVWMQQTYGLNADDRVLQKTPISFDVSVWEFFAPLIAGARLVLARPDGHKDPDYLSRLIADRGITVLHFVPSMLRAFLAEPALETRCGSLRQVIASGEALPFELQERFFQRLPKAALDNLYGPTEAAVEVTAWSCRPGDPRGVVPIGRPIANTRIQVLDRERRPVPIGVAGELHIGGVQVARGYRQRPALTAAAFVPDPLATRPGDRLYATGDLARWHAEGVLTFLGRIDHQVKVRGVRIELGEIEAVLLRHPSLAAAVVVAHAERAGDPRLIAYVVATTEPPDERALRSHLAEQLPEALIPTTFVTLDALPLNPNGKIDRKALPRPAREGPKARSVPPQTPEAATTAAIWQELLGIEGVGMDDRFFELGGHSLLATQVMARLRVAFGVDLPLRTLFESPRLGDLAEAVRRARAAGSDASPAITARERTPGIPLEASFAQERMWLLDRLGGEHAAAYTIAVAADLEGPLDPGALTQALRAVVARHESLRTTFVERDGRPWQRIDPVARLALARADLSATFDPAAEASAQARDLARRPFDLEAGPLLRGVLCRLGENRHRLLLALHHIVADGWSLDVLLREMVALYRQRTIGDHAAFAARTVDYADVAAWQRRWLESGVGDRQLAYWRQQLAGLPALELATDRPRPAVRSGQGFCVRSRLPGDVVRRLDNLAKKHGATRFMALMALFQVLLGRWANQRDFAIGAPIANRQRAETEPLIGLFVNTLVLRANLEGWPSFTELLERVRATCLDAFAHQDLPFEHLVAALEPARDRARTPLFQAMLNLAETPRAAHAMGQSLRLTPVPVPTGTAKVDLLLTLTPLAAGLDATLECSSDLFRPETAERMLAAWSSLLSSAVAEPEQRVSRLAWLPGADRRQLMAWRGRRKEVAGTRVHAVFADQARATPDAIALSMGDARLSYGQLARRCHGLAHRLRDLGVGPEVAVGLLAGRSPAHIIATLAVLEAGGTYVPLDTDYPPERLAFMLADAGVRVLLRAGELSGLLAPQVLPGIEVVDLDPAVLRTEADAPPVDRGGPDDLAYVMYTSGSTGRPKGVAVTHRAILRLVRSNDYVRFDRHQVFLQLAPTSFDAATFEIWGALLNGGRLAIAPPGRLDLETIGRVLATEGVTTLWLTAGLFHQMVEQQLAALAGVRQLLAGGDVLAPEQVSRALDALPETTVINGYGPTENTTFTACHAMRTRSDLGPAAVPIGQPITNTQVYVLDGEGQPTPIGVPGGLWIAGAGLARGYVGRPRETARSFVPDPFSGVPGARMYRSGDRARFLRGGSIGFLGRNDDQVKIRGFRIELGEIERALERLPAVQQAAVVVQDDPATGKRLVAFVVAAARAESLRHDLGEGLPAFMVPAFIELLEALPLTANGKVDRRALAIRPLSASEASAEDAPPANAHETQIATLVAALLGIDTVGRHADFFALGGHSLLATRLIARIRQQLGVELPLEALFEAPTVAGIARAIETLAAAALPPIEPLPAERRARGVLEASFAQERMWLLDRLGGRRGHAQYTIAVAADLAGRLDPGALTQALASVVARHEALRTTFVERDGRPWQRIHPASEPTLPRVDLSALGDPASEASRQALALAQQPFDLATGPLLHCVLLRLGPASHRLVVLVHHIVADGWSLEVLLREIATLYRQATAGGLTPLEPLAVQYADFAAWQRSWLDGPLHERQLAYWRQQLCGLPALELPSDQPRPPTRSGRGFNTQSHLPGDVVARLDDLAQAHTATRFMVLLALFELLLARMAGQRDFAIGAPVANRQRAETEPLIGFFVNTLVLRADLGGSPSFVELLDRVRATCVGAYAHQDLPFENLVAALEPARDRSRTPLFQVMLSLAETPRLSTPVTGDLELTPRALDTGSAKFDLLLALAPCASGLELILEASADLFDPASTRRMLEHWCVLAEAVVEDPLRDVFTLPWLRPEERRQILIDWNPAPPAATAARLDARIRAQAARTPDAVAIEHQGASWSYRRLSATSRRLAHHLRSLGVQGEARVGVALPRSPEMVAVLLAVLEAGGAYVPLDPAYPAARLAFMLRDAGVRLVVSQACVLAASPGLAEAVGEQSATLVDLAADCDPLEEGPATPPASALAATGVADQLAYVIYTSGSTGRPKGVAISHRSAGHLIDWAQREFAGDLESVIAATSINFDLSVFELFAPLATGGRVVLVADALAVAQRESTNARLLNTVPSAAAELLRLDTLPQTVSTINLAGEALPRALANALLARTHVKRVWNLYGPSEDTTYSTGAEVRADDEGAPAIGTPLAGARAYVLDPGLEPAPAGVPGELYLGGDGLARGYLGRPQRSARSFLPDPFDPRAGRRMYRTGDRVRWRHDGQLEFLGRLDHQVKLRGMRIELGEIESRLAEHPEVAACCVALRTLASDTPPMLAAFVEAAGSDAPSPAALAAHLAASLPRHMVPDTFALLAHLPRTPNGKVDRRALDAVAIDSDRSGTGHGARTAAHVAPRNEREAAIATIFTELLGAPDVGVHDDFFALGGHSLLATRAVARLRDGLGFELPLEAFFETPTLAGISQAIEAGHKQTLPPIIAVERAHGALLASSYAQERMWLLDRLAGDAAGDAAAGIYVIAVAADLAGRLDPEVLRGALEHVVARHEALRTSFVERDGRPWQRIHPASELALPRIDLSALGDPAAEAEHQALCLAQQPFDLAAGPLLGCVLLRLGAASHRLVIRMHHIVADGWSLEVLLREIVALYRQSVTGDDATLTPLDMHYADVAAWQRSWLASGVGDRQLAYWRQQLDGVARLELATDRPRPPRRSGRGFTVEARLPGPVAERLDALARTHGATRFMALLALFELLLARLSHQQDFAIGAPVANRRRTETEPLIGFFVNTLVLRADVSGSPSFVELLDRVRATCADAYAHQDLPFERLVAALEPLRDRSRTPLFQAMLTLADTPHQATAVTSDLELTPHALRTATAKTDLVLAVTPSGGDWLLDLELSSDLFAAPSGQRLLGQFCVLAAAAVAAPRAPVHRLALMDAAEQAELARWRSRPRPYPRHASIPDLVEAWAARTPDAIAVSLDRATMTYRQLDRRANALAHRLRAAGVGDETPVALLVERSPGHLVATLAVLKAGGCYVPLDPAFPLARQRLMVEVTGARAVIASAALCDAACGLGALELLPLDTEAMLRGPADERMAPPRRRTGPDHVAYVMFTSGSSGTPKGVAISHRGVVRLLVSNEDLALGPDETWLHYAPATFDAATLEIWGALLNGGRVAVVPPGPASLDALGATIAQQRVTTLFLTAGLFHQMVESQGGRLAGLRQLISGGDVLLPAAVRRAAQILTQGRVVNAYGPTESAVIATTCAFRAPGEVTTPVPIGRPLPNSGILVLDPALRPVPIGVPGELCLLGDGLARGYVGRAARTALAFLPDPTGSAVGARMYRTGDRVRLRSDGDLDFLGRIDAQVKIRGFRIEPGEVESALRALPGVEQAAIVVRDDPRAGKRLVAFAATTIAATELRQALSERLPSFMMPAFLVVLDALPLTANGKLDRAALAAWQLDTEAGAGAPLATPTEVRVGALFAELLGISSPGRDADFFALGGHSLLATKLVSRLRSSFEVELPLDVLFDQPSIAGLAAALDGGAGSPIESQEPLVGLRLPPGAPRPLSPAQERLWLLDRFEPQSAAYNIPTSVRLHGPLDASVLDASLREVIRRHHMLRTVYASDDGRPCQQVGPVPERAIEIDDRRGLDPAEHAGTIEALQAEETGRRFDLATGPVFHARLLRLAHDHQVLFFTVHHIAADGWSVGILVRELGALYRAFARGAPSPLAAPALQYADFAHWQRRWLASGHRARQLAYWQRKLDGLPPGLDLPTDRPRPAIRSFRGRRSTATIGPQLSARLRALARRHEASLFMVLLAAWKVLLARLSGETDVVIGAPVAGRSRRETEDLFGMFLNSLVLRTDLGGDPSFDALIDRVRTTALEAFAHQDVPFETLLESLKPNRDLSRTPMFQVFFNMVNLDLATLTLPAVRSEQLAPAEVPAKFDLTLYVAEPADGSLRLDLVRNADLVGNRRGTEMLHQYHLLLDQVAADSARPIGSLSLRTEAARRVLPDPGARLDSAFMGSVVDRFRVQVEGAPAQAAVVAHDGMTWCYRDLDRQSNRLAQALRSGGLETGQPVAIRAHRSPTLVWAVLGVLKAGGAFVLLDPEVPSARQIQLLRRAKPAVLLAMSAAGSLDPTIRAHLERTACPVLTLPAWSDCGTPEDPLAGQPDSDPAIDVQADDLAYIAFTSGSTGEPKGILGRHGPLSHFLPWQAKRFDLDAQDRYSLLSGLAHDPLHRDLFTPLCLGATICVPDPAEMLVPGRLAAWMAHQRVTIAHLTPAMGQMLTSTGHTPIPTLPALRYVFLVGDVLSRANAARMARLAPAVTVVNYYGTTETQRAVAFHALPSREARRMGEDAAAATRQILPLGRGMQDVQLLVLDRRGVQAGIGELGEIAVRSPHLAAGYLRAARRTAERFTPQAGAGDAGDRIYRTGDLGRYLPDGEVAFAGRRDDQVKIRGFRVELGEIEAQLTALDGVRQAAVLALGNGTERRLIAHLAPHLDRPLDRDTVRQALAARLPAYMVPTTWVLHHELPMTANGKIDRRALARADTGEAPRKRSGGDAPTPFEKRLIALLRELLELDGIDVEDNFFELGANSLLLARVHERLEHMLDRTIPMIALFNHPTVRALAGHLDPHQRPARSRADDDRWVQQLKRGRSRLRRRAGGADRATP